MRQPLRRNNGKFSPASDPYDYSEVQSLLLQQHLAVLQIPYDYKNRIIKGSSNFQILKSLKLRGTLITKKHTVFFLLPSQMREGPRTSELAGVHLLASD